MSENIEPIQPKLKSKVYPGSLTFLRNGFPEANETYMAIHAGNHSIDHWDSDVGAFILYAKGVPLCLDFSSERRTAFGPRECYWGQGISSTPALSSGTDICGVSNPFFNRIISDLSLITPAVHEVPTP